MFRPAETRDLTDLAGFDPFKHDRRGEVAEGRMTVWEVDGAAVGYLTVTGSRFHGYPYLQFLCVRDDHRRRGIASALLRHAEERFAGKRVFVSTESTNAGMLALLGPRGYLRSGALAGLNRDGSEEVFFYKDVPG